MGIDNEYYSVDYTHIAYDKSSTLYWMRMEKGSGSNLVGCRVGCLVGMVYGDYLIVGAICSALFMGVSGATSLNDSEDTYQSLSIAKIGFYPL